MGYGFHRNRKPNLSLLRISVYMLKNIEADKFKNILRACIYANICYMNYHIPQQNKCHHVKQLRTTYLHYYHYLSFKLTSRFFYRFSFIAMPKKTSAPSSGGASMSFPMTRRPSGSSSQSPATQAVASIAGVPKVFTTALQRNKRNDRESREHEKLK